MHYNGVDVGSHYPKLETKNKIMIEYKHNEKENKFTENGHTMFEFDVLQRLKRLADLENKITKGELLPTSVVSESAEKMISYIENDAEIAMPIDRFFNEDGTTITKKKYGHILLEFLCKELREHFL